MLENIKLPPNCVAVIMDPGNHISAGFRRGVALSLATAAGAGPLAVMARDIADGEWVQMEEADSLLDGTLCLMRLALAEGMLAEVRALSRQPAEREEVGVERGRNVREFSEIWRRYADNKITYEQAVELSRQNREASDE